MQEYLQPLFEGNGVQLVFAGHDHAYERTIIHGITYVVSGGGGAPLYGQRQLKNPKSLVFKEVYHFVQVDVTSENLSLRHGLWIKAAVFRQLRIKQSLRVNLTVA